MKFFLTILFFLLSSCQLYTPVPPFIPDSAQSKVTLFDSEKFVADDIDSPFWWKSFESQELNGLIGIALKQNLSIESALQRLKQARENSVVQASFQYPEVGLGIGAERIRSERPGSQITGVESAPDFMRIFNTFSVGGRVSYEVDLWKRVDSLATAASLQADAMESEFQNIVSVLIAETARAWIELKLQAALEHLVENQVATSATYLSLTKIRFGMGLTNGLDVLQQEQQLAGLEALLPAILQQKMQAHSRLASLLGLPRSNLTILPGKPGLIPLPEFPSHLKAQDLFNRRPDLLALEKQSLAAEYQVAARLAERFPKVTADLTYNFSTEELESFFESEAATMGIDFSLPLTDGGRRRASVRAQEARSKELLAQYVEAFLIATNEVATRIDVERLKSLQIDRISLRYVAAKNALKYSRERYQNGALEYLQVLLALQTVQEVERVQLQEQSLLLQNRVALHQALGQPWRVIVAKNNQLSLVIPEKENHD